MRAVAQQHQRDVHTDLGAAAGQQRALSGQVGAGVAPGPVLGRTALAQVVVERVDLGVALLADVAGAGALQDPGDLRGGDGGQAEGAGRLVVDPARGAGRGARGDLAVVGGLAGPGLLAAALLEGAEHPTDGLPDGDRVRVVDVQLVQLGQHLQAEPEPLGVEAGAVVDLLDVLVAPLLPGVHARCCRQSRRHASAVPARLADHGVRRVYRVNATGAAPAGAKARDLDDPPYLRAEH